MLLAQSLIIVKYVDSFLFLLYEIFYFRILTLMGSRQRARPKRTWREVAQKDCQARNLNGRMLWIVVDGGS